MLGPHTHTDNPEEWSEKEMEGSVGTCEGTDDTTTLVQIEEAKYAIRKLPFVTVLTPVRAVGDKGPGWQVSLSCSRCQEYGSCPKKQESAVLLSRVHPTEVVCLLSGAAKTTVGSSCRMRSSSY